MNGGAQIPVFWDDVWEIDYTPLLFNGEDIDGDPIWFNEVTTPPEHGTLTSGPDSAGNFTYSPALDYEGMDHFEYTISDGLDVSSLASAYIYVERPQIDLDTDSDNNALYENSEAEEQVENVPGQPGKRVFINHDDDNKNGMVDKDDPSSTAAENDMVKVNLDFPNFKYENFSSGQIKGDITDIERDKQCSSLLAERS